MYVGDESESLSGYSVNTATGALTPLNGFPITFFDDPMIVATDPQNRFLFVGNAGGALQVFTIDSSTGALTSVGTSGYALVSEPWAISVDPSGTHVYVASLSGNSVAGFNLSSTGAITPIAGSPLATSGTQQFGDGVIVNAAGTFVYSQDLVNIYVYSVTAGSGALTLVQTVPGPYALGGIAMDPHRTYIYANGSAPSSNAILAYSINSSTGLLTLAHTSPMVEGAAYTISISPTGQFAYTIENNNDLVSYILNDGVFTPVGPVYSQVYGQRIGIDPSGSFVYVPQSCQFCPSGVYNVVHEFSIGSTGALTRIPGSPVAAGTTPWSIAFTSQ